MAKTRVRNSVFYGIATGVTILISAVFLVVLNRLTEHVGITVLIVSLIVCVVAVLYFVSRWYLTEILAAPLRQNANQLFETLENEASGVGTLEHKVIRMLIFDTYCAIREFVPTVWFVVMAGSLMGAVVVVVGLVIAAVIFQQTEVLERQTSRIDDQTKVMAVEFMNQSAIGLANIDQRLADLRRADRNFLRAQITENDVREILLSVPGTALGDDNRIDICTSEKLVCEATLEGFKVRAISDISLSL